MQSIVVGFVEEKNKQPACSKVQTPLFLIPSAAYLFYLIFEKYRARNPIV
jgi:hypothetical protein